VRHLIVYTLKVYALIVYALVDANVREFGKMNEGGLAGRLRESVFGVY
jgi:hypothetical protein